MRSLLLPLPLLPLLLLPLLPLPLLLLPLLLLPLLLLPLLLLCCSKPASALCCLREAYIEKIRCL